VGRESRDLIEAVSVSEEIDEDESDRRNLAAIQGRIEARRAVKDLESARATIAELKEASDKVFAATTKLSGGGLVRDKTEAEKKPGAKRGAKKGTGIVPIPAADEVMTLVSEEAATAPGPDRPSAVDVIAPTEQKRPRSGKSAITERQSDNALTTLKFTAIANSRPRDNDLVVDDLEMELGMAFVAGALGKKVPYATPHAASAGLADCYVELSDKKKRNRAASTAVPPNSVESVELETLGEAREDQLDQSDVQVGLPEETAGMDALILKTPVVDGLSCPTIGRGDGAFAFATSLIEVSANEEVVAGLMEPRTVTSTIPSEIPRTVATGHDGGALAMTDKITNKQRMIREIAASQLLSEELAKSDPNLVSVFAFMNKVCGTEPGAQKLREAALSAIKKGDVAGRREATVQAVVTPTGSAQEAGPKIVRQAGEGVLETTEIDEGMHDDATTAAVVPTGGEGCAIDPESRTDETMRDVIADLGDASVEVIRDSVIVDDDTDVISLVETVMSVEGSSSDDDQSSSSSGSSVSESGTRKRLAEGSPEREEGEGTRREFPGRVTRSAGGCRVYVPTDNLMTLGDIMGRVLNDDGTIVQRVTLGQDNGPDIVGQAGTTSTDGTAIAEIGAPLIMTPITDSVVSGQHSPRAKGNADTWLTPALNPRCQVPVTSTPEFLLQPERGGNVRSCVAIGLVTTGDEPTFAPEPIRVIEFIDEFGRDTCVVNEVCQLIEGMPRPWSAYRAFEAATARFPNIDRSALRLTVLAVLMGQRRCAINMTTAGINSACADDYRNSF